MRLLLIFAIATTAFAQVSDPFFSTIPFDKWTEAGQTRLKWRAEVAIAGLTDHQRLMYRVEARVDGAEMVRRRGKGAMVTLVEFKDSQGRVFQTHGSMDLESIKDEAVHSDLQYLQDVFLTPGEYKVATAVYATTTGDYAIARRTLRVDALPRDPLPDAWSELPGVEFVPAADVPEAWYLPSVVGRLKLPIETHRRVDIEILVNATPSEETPGTRAERMSRNMMRVLLPSTKTLVQLHPQNGSMSMAMFDLARQKITFQSTRGLYWDELKPALTETSSPKIDVHALEKRQGNAQFFVKEVARRVEDSHAVDALHVLIVLSAPMAFAQGEDLRPIQTSSGKNCKVFYFRYAPAAPRFVLNPLNAPVPQRRGGSFPPALPPPPSDSLEKTLKPLEPRLYDVTTPAEFRKSLAAMMEEIARAAR